MYLKKILSVILLLFIIASPCRASNLQNGDHLKKALNDYEGVKQGKEKAAELPSKINNNIDFGPYIKDLQHAIRSNWNPPKWQGNRKTELKFKVEKDGSVSNIEILTSSGDRIFDNAGISAVKASEPFKPFPVEYKKQSMDIQFVFASKISDKN